MEKRAHHHHDAHAHYVEQPSERLMRQIRLPFVLKRVLGHGARSPNASLNLTSYIDFLLVTVIFLLMSFSANGDIIPDKSIKLAQAENVLDVVDAPMIAVNGNQVLLDGQSAGSTRAIEDMGRLQKIDELFERLKRTRELWTSFHPGKVFPGVAILQIDQEVPALVVKSVFQTAAFAGYPNVSFMVRKRAKVGA